MLPRAFFRPALIVWFSVVGATLLAPGAVYFQLDSIGSRQDLDRDRVKYQNRFEQLITGAEQPEPADKEAMDAFARLYVYRMTDPTLMGLANNERSRFPQLVGELENQIKTHALPQAAKNQEFMKQWTERMVTAFQQSFEKILPNASKNRVAVVGVSMLLPVYAKTKQQKFAEYLQGLVADEKQNEIVKLYALKALSAYGEARAHKASDDFSEEPELRKVIDRDTRRVEALLKSTNRKWDGLDPAAAQFIRRQAIRALAETRVPAMDVLKDGKVVAPVAYTLLRVLVPGKDALNPPPSLTEKFEAAVGIARMHGKYIDAYQPEPGLYLLGQFVIEFATEYQKDYENFGGKLLKKEERKIPAQPWKKMATELSKALKKVQTGIRDNHPAYAKAGQLAAEAQRLLPYIQTHSAIPDTNGITRATSALAPSSGALFKGNKDYQVPVGPAGGD